MSVTHIAKLAQYLALMLQVRYYRMCGLLSPPGVRQGCQRCNDFYRKLYKYFPAFFIFRKGGKRNFSIQTSPSPLIN